MALARVCVSVRPSCRAPYATVVLGLEDLREYRGGSWCEKRLSHEDQLIVYCAMLALGVDMSGGSLPSVFQQAAGASNAAPYSSVLVSITSVDDGERDVYGITGERGSRELQGCLCGKGWLGAGRHQYQARLLKKRLIKTEVCSCIFQ